MSNPKSLFDKIKALPPDHLLEVEEFVDLVAARAQNRAVVRAAAVASAQAFENIWNDPDDDAYDA